MEDVVKAIAVLTLITIVAALGMAVGVAAVIVVAVVGVATLLFYASRAMFAIGTIVYKHYERKHLLTARRAALLTGQIEAEAEYQEQARRRKEREAVRQAEEAAKRRVAERELIEADYRRRQAETVAAEIMRDTALARARADQELIAWKRERLNRRRSQNGFALDDYQAMTYAGRHVHVVAHIGSADVWLQWRATTDDGTVPRVVALRGRDLMFCVWEFAGEHRAALPPGRHVLSFRVDPVDQQPDVFFEVFIPEPTLGRTVGEFRKAVGKKARDFVNRTTTVANAKRKVGDVLTQTGHDPDEATVEVARFEAEIRDIARDE